MRSVLGRIRGALGTAVTWALGWAPFGALWGVGHWLSSTNTASLSYVMIEAAINFAAIGFLGGTAFSVVVNYMERNRRFDELSIPRFGGWGLLGGALLSSWLLMSNAVSPLSLTDIVLLATVPLLGAGSAAGTLALASREDDRELLEASVDVAEAGLTKREALELLG